MSDKEFMEDLERAIMNNQYIESSDGWVGKKTGSEKIRVEFSFTTGAPGKEEFVSIDSRFQDISSNYGWTYTSVQEMYYNTNIQFDGATNKYFVLFEK